MSFDPTSIISVIQNCRTLYGYATDVKHSFVERGRLLEEVRSLQAQLEALQRLANTPGVAGDQASMERLAQLLDPSQPFARVVEKTLARIKDVLTYGTSNFESNRFKALWKRGAAALWWTVDKADVQDLLSDLERFKSRLGLALQHDMFNQMITEYRLKVAKFISDNDFSSHQRILSEQRLPETGTWLLQHPKFVAWRDDEDSERTVWCHGFAGVGKSVIAALIVDHLRSRPGTIVLSVFCRYSLDTFTSPFPVLRGLLRQLIEKSPNVPPALYDLYRSQTDPDPKALPAFLNNLAALHARPIYIIIDALDECPVRIDLLLAVQNLDPSFRILVTSRPVFAEIQEHFTIQICAADEDILVAVDTTLQKLKHTWLDEELKDAIRANIVYKANGMFLLASLQLRELERDVTCQRDVFAILDSLPRTLGDAYKLTFQRIREQGERKNELVCRTLALITLNRWFFNHIHLQHLLAEGDRTQYTDIQTVLQSCHGLVQRDDRGGFEFIHYSVHEYTTANWSDLFPENPNQSNVCLKLGYSILIKPNTYPLLNLKCWDHIVRVMGQPEELDQIIYLLSTPAAKASLLEYIAEPAPIVHDPLLVACYCAYLSVMQYIIQTASPDVQRFNEAIRVSGAGAFSADCTRVCLASINARRDMRVNSDGVVVALGPDEG